MVKETGMVVVKETGIFLLIDERLVVYLSLLEVQTYGVCRFYDDLLSSVGIALLYGVMILSYNMRWNEVLY